MLTEQNGIQVDKFYPPADWQYSFPEGYTRLEYLEGDGKAYINTGITASQDTILKCRVSSNNTGVQAFIGLSDSGLYGIGQQSSSNLLFGQYKTSGSANRILSDIAGNDGIIRNFELRKNEFYINNTYIGNNTAKTFTTTEAIKLFTFNTTTISKVKIYSVQIYSDTILQANLFPAKRNSDGVLGIYNLVNNEFLINSGTGTFIAGPTLYQNKTQIDIRQKNNLNFSKNYEFNANNELTWANPNMYLTGKVNYTKVGNPTITDNVVSGFSTNDYITANNALPTTTGNNYIFEGEASVSELTGNTGYIFSFYCNQQANNSVFGLAFRRTGKFMITETNGSNTTVHEGTLSYQANTNYKYRLETDLNTYVRLYINGNLDISITLSYTNIHPYNGTVFFGCYSTISIVLTKGSIDLKETYIKVNDKLWFYGKNYTSENYAPVPAGLNYNNTTTPSIGYVNTQTQEFIPAPTDGIKYSQTRDIKVIPPEDNTITLLYGVKSDSSKYSLFGLLASVSSGTYDVYIDDVLFATTASATQTDIDFSTLGSEYVPIGTATTPEELVLHKVMIKPNTSGATITKFRCARTADVTIIQQQGVLWIHFELENIINITNLFCTESQRRTYNLYAITAKNNKILVSATSNTSSSGMYSLAGSCTSLVYLPILEFSNKNYTGGSYLTFNYVPAKRIIIKNNGSFSIGALRLCQAEKIETEHPIKFHSGIASTNNANSARNLKLLPKTIKNDTTVTLLAKEYNSLYPTKINDSLSINREYLNIAGTNSYPAYGIQSLKVSNSAPFSGTSPQIDVSYTGLDRDALVELFNSLPDVSEATDEITRAIDITAATGNNLTLSGNATIDENGILSNLDSSSSAIIQSIPTSYNSIEVLFKIAYPNMSSSNFIPVCAFNSVDSQRRITISSSGGTNFYYNNSNILINISTTEFNYLSYANNGFYLKLRCDKKQSNYLYTLSLSTDKSTWVTKSVESTYKIFTDTLYLLRNASGVAGGYPQMFLEETYVKADSNYIMKGYLTDNDRLIATNKGWTITG